MKEYWTYIMVNIGNTTLYTGITNNLQRRVYEHREKLIDGFTKKYNLTKLVFFERFNSPEQAIVAEKRIKGWVRSKKIRLIESKNPKWEDLYENL